MTNANPQIELPHFAICIFQFAICNRPFQSARRRTVFAFVLLLLAGCNRGPQLAPVTGRVTLDNKPLEAAEITFQPDKGTASYGRTDQDGRYELRYTRDEMGALVGPHTVRIRAATEFTGPRGQSIVRPQLVPARYHAESELRRDVADEDNVFDFDLEATHYPKIR